MDPVEFAVDRKKFSTASALKLHQNENRQNLTPILRAIGGNKVLNQFSKCKNEENFFKLCNLRM